MRRPSPAADRVGLARVGRTLRTWSIRLVAPSVILAILAPPTEAAPAGRCSAVPVPTDSQDVTCVFDAAASGRPLRFVAWFGGSHDDTTIKLEAALDGKPLRCAAGSKTSLSFEDGTVYLDCRFEAPPGASSPSSLQVALTVHHAQYLLSSIDDE